MKTFYLIVALVLFVSASFAQTIGVKAGPNATITGRSDDAGYGFSGGVFYDQPIYKKLGISTGIYFTRLKAANLGFPNIFMDRTYDHRFDIVEIPIDLTADLTMQPEKKLRFYMTCGYAFGQIIDKTEIVYTDDEKWEEEITQLTGLVSQLHFFRFGIESRYNVSDKINLGLGCRYKYTRIYDDVYGDFNNWNVFLKAGYNLN